MSVLNLARAVAAEAATPGPKPAHQVYTSAVVLALFSFGFTLLILMPMYWHARNRNVGATALIAWLVLLLLSSFVNAIIWPSDNMNTWFNGVGLCDIEVKIQVASQVALPASFACIMRALSAVLDTTRTTLSQTKAQKQRAVVIDLLFCVGFPLLQTLSHYIVQTRRFYIYGIAGCVPAYSPTWPSIPLLILPPALWTVYDTYLAALILVRLYRYRLSFSNILANNGTTKSRFMRLYLICVLWVVGGVPVEIWIISSNLKNFSGKPYSWSAVHDSGAWAELVKVPSQGRVRFDRWIWVGVAAAVFVFLGYGKEALTMYRAALDGLGLGRISSSLRDAIPNHRTSFGSVSGKARSLFTWKSTNSTAESGTQTSSTSGDIVVRKSVDLSVDVEKTEVHQKHGNSMEMKGWQ